VAWTVKELQFNFKQGLIFIRSLTFPADLSVPSSFLFNIAIGVCHRFGKGSGANLTAFLYLQMG
jgi:hypothetical protein